MAPGAIQTDFGGGAVHDNAKVSAFVSSITATRCVACETRKGTADAAEYQASDLADDVSSQHLLLSGGAPA